MNVRHLETFIAIVEEGSLTKAADRVCIVQSALTRQVKVLEEHFGVPLLIRSLRGVQPTEAGARLVTHARTLLAQFAALQTSVIGSGQIPAGEVRVGIPANLSSTLSPRLIYASSTMYPDVRIHIVEPMVGVITQWLEQTKVDFALSYTAAHPASIETEKVLTEALDLCCSPISQEAEYAVGGQGLPFARACALPLIVPHRGYSIREMLEANAQHVGCRLNVSLEIDSHGPVKALVEQGLGYAFLPSVATVVERSQNRLVTRRVVAPHVERPVYIVGYRERQLTSAGAAVRTICRSVLADLIHEGVWDARMECGA